MEKIVDWRILEYCLRLEGCEDETKCIKVDINNINPALINNKSRIAIENSLYLLNIKVYEITRKLRRRVDTGVGK